MDDDPEFAVFARSVMEDLSCTAATAASLAEAGQRLDSFTPDLILLDLHLPDGCGLELCKRVRADSRLAKAVVLVLSSQDSASESLAWLNAGADLCLPKFFSVLRLKATAQGLLLRRQRDSRAAENRLNAMEFDPIKRRLTWGPRCTAVLSRREYDLLRLISVNHPLPTSRQEVAEKFFGAATEDLDLAINDLLRHLRKKLFPELLASLKTVRGSGYKLDGPVLEPSFSYFERNPL